MVNGEIRWPGWETVGLIGRGSFGAVYEIRRDVLGETEKAALKVISIPQSSNDIEEMYSDGYDDESITATFKEHLKSIVAEYSLMRKMGDCVNIVKCDDVRYIQHDNGIGWDIFIKMELLTPLTKALPDVIPEEMVIKLAKDMCSALDACKKQDVIHRDIKPQNIFVSERGDYKLGDFGIAKTVERTASGTKIGTYKYMAPEVYNNQPYGGAADIYSLGLVLYWMLNDRRMPFLPSSSQKITAGMEEEARSRRFAGEDLPAPAHGSAALKSIVLKACAFNPKDRYMSPREMSAEIKKVLTGNPFNKQEQSSSRTGERTYNTSTEKITSPKNSTFDVTLPLVLTAQEAANGCTKIISIPAGVVNISVKVPAGAKDGAVLRLTGAGKQDAATGARGDVYLKIRIISGKSCAPPKEPKKTTEKEPVQAKEKKKGITLLSYIAWFIWIILSIVGIFTMGVLGAGFAAAMLLICAWGVHLMRSGKNKALGRIIVFVVPMVVGIPLSIAGGSPIGAAILLVVAGVCSCIDNTVV